MASKTPPTRPGKQSDAEAREDRLKAALKANMARRKQQARARNSTAATGDATKKTNNEGS